MRLCAVVLIAILASGSGFCQVKLPRLISDGMILQRSKPVAIWGWASENEYIELTFKGKQYSVVADKQGKWKIMLPAQPAGGPYEIKIKGKNELIIKDVLFGDVWVCSGQSNMELDINRAKDAYPNVVANANNNFIRQFLVPDKYDFKNEHTDLDGGSWQPVNSKTIYSFTAVGYFFANELYQKYGVPIGLINSALGGSPAEAWISEDALKNFPNHYTELQKFKDDNLIQSIEKEDYDRTAAWYRELNNKDSGIKTWSQTEWNDSDWAEMKIPGYWTDGPVGNQNGAVWFRKKVSVSKSMVGKPGKIWFGRIVDADSVFINGRFIGTVGYQYPPRKYEVPTDVLREGENAISVRIISNSGRGGFVLDKPYFLAVGNDTIDLKGIWKYKLGASMMPLAGATTIRWKPAGLYNRMISPLLNYSIKGVIWYQGESNTGRAKEYQTLFPALINNWRQKWGQGDFPFLAVQLANFMEAKAEPVESQWAELREAQSMILRLPKTSMAVIIDAGEWNDIHPLDKATVGKRLALSAQKIAYREKIVHTGPTVQSYKIEGAKVIIEFDKTSPLIVKGAGQLKQFAIAGSDKKFVWAKAVVEKNKVVVWSDRVANPVAVRYAWADNPVGANLYNKAGLPASPFRIGDN